jgi:hypothetical protein
MHDDVFSMSKQTDWLARHNEAPRDSHRKFECCGRYNADSGPEQICGRSPDFHSGHASFENALKDARRTRHDNSHWRHGRPDEQNTDGAEQSCADSPASDSNKTNTAAAPVGASSDGTPIVGILKIHAKTTYYEDGSARATVTATRTNGQSITFETGDNVRLNERGDGTLAVTFAETGETLLYAVDGSVTREAGDPGLLHGTDGDDVLLQIRSNSVMDAGAGNDVILVLGRNCAIEGGDGNDHIILGKGTDGSRMTVYGGNGNDMLLARNTSFVLGDMGAGRDGFLIGIVDGTFRHSYFPLLKGFADQHKSIPAYDDHTVPLTLRTDTEHGLPNSGIAHGHDDSGDVKSSFTSKNRATGDEKNVAADKKAGERSDTPEQWRDMAYQTFSRRQNHFNAWRWQQYSSLG